MLSPHQLVTHGLQQTNLHKTKIPLVRAIQLQDAGRIRIFSGCGRNRALNSQGKETSGDVRGPKSAGLLGERGYEAMGTRHIDAVIALLNQVNYECAVY